MFTHPPIILPTCTLIHSSTHSSTYSLIHPPTHLPIHLHPFIYSSTNPSIHLPTTQPSIHLPIHHDLFIYLLTDSLSHLFIHLPTCSPTQPPTICLSIHYPPTIHSPITSPSTHVGGIMFRMPQQGMGECDGSAEWASPRRWHTDCSKYREEHVRGGIYMPGRRALEHHLE